MSTPNTPSNKQRSPRFLIRDGAILIVGALLILELAGEFGLHIPGRSGGWADWTDPGNPFGWPDWAISALFIAVLIATALALLQGVVWIIRGAVRLARGGPTR